MEKKNIIKKYKKKIKIIQSHNKLYFSYDKPKIPDSEYDKIKKEILDLEKKYNFLKKDSEKYRLVGAPPSNKFKKIKHLAPMLSLANAFDINDMKDFLKKLITILNLKTSKSNYFVNQRLMASLLL